MRNVIEYDANIFFFNYNLSKCRYYLVTYNNLYCYILPYEEPRKNHASLVYVLFSILWVRRKYLSVLLSLNYLLKIHVLFRVISVSLCYDYKRVRVTQIYVRLYVLHPTDEA